MDIVLYQPEIPPNTGNIIRLSANLGANLHLVKPYGFEMDDKRLRRAGLDYRALAHVTEHENWEACRAQLDNRRWLALSTRGSTIYSNAKFDAGDVLLFGPETRGLPDAILAGLPADQVLRIPMHPQSRSLNLANAVAVVAFEHQRQRGFTDLI